MKRTLFFILLLIGFIFGYWKINQDFTKNEDTIYINGNIITLEDSTPFAEAMFVKNGKIETIGTSQEIIKLKSNNCKIIDLKKATVLPGFIDPHTHVALSTFFNNMIDLSGFKHQTNKEVWSYLREQIKTKKKGEWIVCKGIDPILVKDLIIPDIQFLDEIAPKNPIILISQSLHSYWVNSLTFQKSGITNSTKNPSKTSYYDRDEEGKLNGFIAEQEAFLPILELMKKEYLTSKMLIKSTVNVMHKYALNGNTTVVSEGITINDKKPLRLYQHISDKKTSFLNQVLSTIGMLPKRTPSPRHFIYIRHNTPFLLPEKKTDNDFYNIIGIKHWYDGAPYTGSMYLKEPYLFTQLTQKGFRIKKGSRGKALVKKENFINFIKKYTKKGWQISVHTQGDIANKEVYEAFKEANTEIDITKNRHRIEHCILVSDSTLIGFKNLKLTPSFHINHLYYYGKALSNDILGEQRAQKLLPVATAQRIGLTYSLHADQPMFESKPFRLIQTAIERQTKEGDTLGYNFRISLKNALKALTINAAWQIHMEDKLGSLKKGKYADFIIIDKNPFKTKVHELENIQIVKTFINGNEVK